MQNCLLYLFFCVFCVINGHLNRKNLKQNVKFLFIKYIQLLIVEAHIIHGQEFKKMRLVYV